MKHSLAMTVRTLGTLVLAALAATGVCAGQEESSDAASVDMFSTHQVSGTGVHFFSTALIHEQRPTEVGMIQLSTDIVRLEGDLTGVVLYHPRSVFDFASGTLVNTGHQVFSGTIRGSKPVMLYDDGFRFEVDLATGETVGRVFLVDRLAGPVSRCRLEIFGTGQTEDGDATLGYTGTCRVNPRANPVD